MTTRAYSLLTIKAVDDGKRIIRGIATTPAVDRVGDVILPLGVKFTNPMPLLWQHMHDKPIGWVKFDKPTKDGITFEAELPVVTEDGALRERIEEAWQSIKLGLVRAVSIGFRPLKFAWIGDYEGIEYQEIEVFELSAVTIPAQQEALITDVASKSADALVAVVKSFDTGAPVATDRPAPPAKTPGVTGKSHSITLTPKEGKDMTISEQIAALEAKRAATAARMAATMQKSIDAGRTSDQSEQEQFDNDEAELKTIDADLKRLKSLEAITASTARPVDPAIRDGETGAAVRTGAATPAEIRLKKTEAPGVRFARLAKVRAFSRMESISVAEAAAQMYGKDSEVYNVVAKAVIEAGSNASGNWAAALHGEEGSGFADFASFLRPYTILGKFGTGNIPALRQVPFDQPLILQTGGGAGYWVGEGKPKPTTKFGFSRSTLTRLKVANISVLTEENIRSTNPSSELIVRDSLRDALVEVQDLTFVDPTNAGSANVKPASIAYGADYVISTGDDADAIRLDVRAVVQKFIDAENPPEMGVWLMSAGNALALSMIYNPLGQKEFPDISMKGGMFEGFPVIVSSHLGDNVELVNASDIYLADDGEIQIDMSREASIEMLDSALVQDGAAGTGASLVSLWQNNLVGLRAERTINWKLRRAGAVGLLKSVSWGGAVPAS